MIRIARKTSPATRTGRSSRRERAGAISQRRTITTVVIVARARPPYSPVGPGIDVEQRRGEQEVEAGRPDGQDRHRHPVDARRQPTARIGEDQRKQQDGRGVLERQADLADDRDRRMGERPDEPGQPDRGHQRAGPVGRLVAPDRESAVQVRQPDREVQQAGARCLAFLEAERLGGDRHDRAESPDGEAEAAAIHAGTLTHGIAREEQG